MMRAWLLVLSVTLVACSQKPLATVPYRQDFSGPLGQEWQSASSGWRVVEGRLFNDGARNVPLWLNADLPDNVRISMTALSESPAVDLKFEVFGDGEHHASGYIVILGGWKNTKSLIARLDEHGPDQTSRPSQAKTKHAYQLRFERYGGALSFFVDGELYLRFDDPAPLVGPGHKRFAFNNWASRVYFDNLVIEPL